MGTTSLEAELEDNTNLCGTLFSVGNTDGVVFSKRATIGGAVILGDRPCGVTVVHPFLNFWDYESADEDDLDLDDDCARSDSQAIQM